MRPVSPPETPASTPLVAIHLPPKLARQCRRIEDLTQFALAEKAAVNYARLVKFEQSRLQLSPDELLRIIAALPTLQRALAAGEKAKR